MLARSLVRGVLTRASRCAQPARLVHSVSPRESLALTARAADVLGPVAASPAEAAGLSGEPLALAASVDWGPVAAVHSALVSLHDVSGMPWWATLVAGTLVVRALVLPAVVYQQRQAARLVHLRPLLRAVADTCKHIESVPRRQSAMWSGMWRVCVQQGVHPASLLAAPLVQLPVFVTCILAVRRLMTTTQADIAAAAGVAAGMDTAAAAGGAVEEGVAAGPASLGAALADGGALWFCDLTVADPLSVLPILTVGSFLLTTELAASRPAADGAGSAPAQEKSPAGRAFDWLRRRLQDMGVIALPAMAQFPAGLFLYWLTSNLASIAQGVLLRSQWARSHPLLSPPPPPHLQSAAGAIAAGRGSVFKALSGGAASACGVRATARTVRIEQAAALAARGESQAAAEVYRGLVAADFSDIDAALGLSKLLLASEGGEARAMAVQVLKPLRASFNTPGGPKKPSRLSPSLSH
ncbi:60Kd inner membrane protein-domain-containing protein [Pavlovales sp. CCMP2436]|nr:60Kd inner membrane protein-domain-containing protein [Pavlovales sp. CCMP2436]